jgi:putative DNA-invertase from lambdoid prophage Rac
MNASRIFSYRLASLADQDAEAFINFNETTIPEFRQLTENDNSSMLPALMRPVFNELLIKLESGDSVVVTKLTTLGITLSDISKSLRILGDKRIGVVSLDIENGELGVDQIALVSKVLGSFKSVPEPVEKGKPNLGRPSHTTDAQQVEIYSRLKTGESVSSLARAFDISRSSIINIRKKFKATNPKKL